MTRYTPTTARTVNQINAELQKIKLAIDDTLSRKGDSPNTMEGSLDMNSNRVLNLQDAILDQEPMTLSQGTTLTTEVATEVASYVATNVATNVALEHSGWIPVSFTFASGGSLTGVSEIIIYNGGYWRWDGALPKTVTAGSSPTPVGVGSWLLVSGDIDNSKHAREFGAYSDMIANADYSIAKTGQKVSTGGTSWRTTTTVTPVVIANTSPQLYAKPLNGIWLADFGIVEGADFSAALRLAVSIAGGTSVHIPNARYIYDGVNISTDVVKIKGARMPSAKAGYTGLKNGTIIEGSLKCSGKNVHLSDFGVDLGSDTSAPSGDGIKCTTSLNIGEHLHVENLVALGKSPSDTFHSLLFESYQKVTGGNLTGINNWFSCVIKCKDVNLSSIYCRNSEKQGLYLKSDSNFGRSWYINIDELNADGNGQAGNGILIQSAGAQLDKVSFGRTFIRGYGTPIKVDVNGTNGVAINEIDFGNCTIIGATGRALYLEASLGFIYTVKWDSMTIIDVEGTAIDTLGLINHLQAGKTFISYKATIPSDIVMDTAVQIKSSVLNTSFSDITICKGYSTATLGTIKYDNPSSNNLIGIRRCKLSGAGVPLNGFSQPAISGATVTLTPSDNTVVKMSTIKASMTADSTVTSIADERYAGVKFESGHKLTVINNSSFVMTINHNIGGKITNKGAVPVVLAINEAAEYVYGGAVWHQI